MEWKSRNDCQADQTGVRLLGALREEAVGKREALGLSALRNKVTEDALVRMNGRLDLAVCFPFLFISFSHHFLCGSFFQCANCDNPFHHSITSRLT
jgi:hypothetical protein